MHSRDVQEGNNAYYRYALAMSAGIAWFGAVIHFIAPWMGPDWLAYLRAPHDAVAAARVGDMTVYGIGIIIGLLMLLAGFYAQSAAAGRWLPLTVPALWVLSILCTVRGLGALLVLGWLGRLAPTFDAVASAIWWLAGIGFAAGLVYLSRMAKLGKMTGHSPNPGS